MIKRYKDCKNKMKNWSLFSAK